MSPAAAAAKESLGERPRGELSPLSSEGGGRLERFLGGPEPGVLGDLLEVVLLPLREEMVIQGVLQRRHFALALWKYSLQGVQNLQ